MIGRAEHRDPRGQRAGWRYAVDLGRRARRTTALALFDRVARGGSLHVERDWLSWAARSRDRLSRT
jgi:hypothetical protein